MPSGIDHPAAWPVEQLLKRCEIKRLRRGGPGGQHRNKVETAVIVHDPVTGQSGEGNERRSQEANRQVAIFRLRVNLAIHVIDEIDLSTTPSELWRSRVRSGKVAVNPTHDDFPAILAEAITILYAEGWDASAAAARLGCSTSQLVKLLKNEPAAFTLLNRQREALGLKPLK
ncbi:peptide chain release factor-like protein [Bremerella volcania]|uniref:Peptide chain release factor-like protein n=1 Tax=Bremerella volcania TaxID=2527984 RepID=A0A518CAC8_9BACT|nr:peptide chain release factor-like protein [Bremerella volcania]QDU76144.1 peptide chain release factor-like protein [Bremerella volcania]